MTERVPPARLRALQRAALASVAPVPLEPAGIACRLSRIIEQAVAALGARDGRIILAGDPAWRDLSGEAGALAPPDEAIVFDRTGRLRRTALPRDGATAHALATGEPVVVPDTLAPVRFGTYAHLAERGIRALAITPLRAGDEVLGALSIAFGQPRDVPVDERNLLEVFSACAAAALDRIRLARAERRRTFQAEQLAATLAQVSAASNLDGALEALLKGAMALLDGDEGVVQLFEPHTGQRRLMLRMDWGGAIVARSTTPDLVPGSFAAALKDGGPPVLVEDFQELDPDAYPLYEQLRQRGIRSAVNVPIEAHGQRIGSLHINHHRRAFFGPADLAVAEMLARQAGAAIERAILEAAREADRQRLAAQAEALRRREAEAAALRELDRLKDELLWTISHELRTPLTAVHGYAQRLAARARSLDRAAIERAAAQILSGAQQLTRLVDDLVDLGRAERGEVLLQLEDFDLQPVLRQVLAGFASTPGGERLVADLPPRLLVHADPVRVIQVVSNLIANALKYAPDGPIVVRARRRAATPGAVRVEVVDQGPGIPPEEQARIWDLFSRGTHDREQGTRGGSGIGLAVVRRLVEAHAGRVGVESAPARGACFWFEIPRRAERRAG